MPVTRDSREPCVRPPLYNQPLELMPSAIALDIQVHPEPSSTRTSSTHAIYEAEMLAKYTLLDLNE
jgi:hypothetical protein